MVVVVGPIASDPVAFTERVLEERAAALSLPKVRSLLAGRVADDQIEVKAQELLQAAVLRRIQGNQSVAVVLENLAAAERERYVRLAHGHRRPRHLILLEARRDQVLDDERVPLDELRRGLDANELGGEGFQTVMRLGGSALAEVKRIVFQPPPREDR